MAQHVINRLYVEKDRKREFEVFEAIKDDYCGIGSIDFAKIIPMYEKVKEEGGETRVIKTSNVVRIDGYRRYIMFDTAWGASFLAIRLLSKMFPDVLFTHEWDDESFGENCGRLVYKNGACIGGYRPKTEREQFEFGAHVKGVNLTKVGYALNWSERKYVDVWEQEYHPVTFNGLHGLYAESKPQPKNVPKGLYVYGLKAVDKNTLAIVKRPKRESIILKEPLDFGHSNAVLIAKDNLIINENETANYEQLLLGDFDHHDDYLLKHLENIYNDCPENENDIIYKDGVPLVDDIDPDDDNEE